MFEELKKTEESTSKQLHAQDSSRLGEINRRISELTDKTVKSLGDIRADVKARNPSNIFALCLCFCPGHQARSTTGEATTRNGCRF